MKVGAGIGLAALIIAMIGMWLPVIGLFIGWVALVIACIAALCGDKGFSIATVIVSAVAFLFLTPSLWVETAASSDPTSGYGAPVLRIMSMVLLAAPVASMVLFSAGKGIVKRTKPRSDERV